MSNMEEAIPKDNPVQVIDAFVEHHDLSHSGFSISEVKINNSLHKPYCGRMHKRLQDNLDYATRVSKIKSKTVEPVLGTMINFTTCAG
jgi:hypothetical protein